MKMKIDNIKKTQKKNLDLHHNELHYSVYLLKKSQLKREDMSKSKSPKKSIRSESRGSSQLEMHLNKRKLIDKLMNERILDKSRVYDTNSKNFQSKSNRGVSQ